MRKTYTDMGNYGVISSNIKKDKAGQASIKEFYASKKEIQHFPFAIFCDDTDPEEKVQELLSAAGHFYTGKKPVILVIKTDAPVAADMCWRLLAAGIDDVIEWETLNEVFCYLEARHERHIYIQEILHSEIITENLIGSGEIWKRFLAKIIEVSVFSQASVLLIGESGTGKELISRLIHSLDTREDKKKLVVVDCTTLAPELSGSELFGHERGSYTSAIQSREGAFSLANGGTLFLDEVGELPLQLQAELLRVVQEGTFKKIGSNTWQKTSFRLVCATNRNLKKMMEEGKFRPDLYYRIADFEYHVPSLNERKDDIPGLVNFFLSKFSKNGCCPETDKLVMDFLVNRDYPGNIRELKQLVQRIMVKHVLHKRITIGEIPSEDRCCSFAETNPVVNGLDSLIRKSLLLGENWWMLKNSISETAIRVALDIEQNNKQKAAERLGVDVRTVQQYVKKKIN